MAAKRTKKIYRYVPRLVEVCLWCNGSGRTMGSWHSEECLSCNGTGGKWKQVRELVGEEVIE